MNKTQLQELARLGVRHKLEEYERLLGDLYAEFPDEFVGQARPVLRRPQGKTNDWPETVVAGDGHLGPPPDETRADAIRAILGDGRARSNREILTALMARGQKAVTLSAMYQTLRKFPGLLQTGEQAHRTYRLAPAPARRAKKTRAKKPQLPTKAKETARPSGEVAWGTFIWERIHDFLLTQENRTARLKDIRTAVDAGDAAAISAMVGSHKKHFRRSGPGVYRLVSPVKPPVPRDAAEST